jgi:hypothetical protein
MHLHNNRVGRKLLAASLYIDCKCHGVSGSCVTKTCWYKLPDLTKFAKILKLKYEQAQQVPKTPIFSIIKTSGNNNAWQRRSSPEADQSDRTLRQCPFNFHSNSSFQVCDQYADASKQRRTCVLGRITRLLRFQSKTRRSGYFGSWMLFRRSMPWVVLWKRMAKN